MHLPFITAILFVTLALSLSDKEDDDADENECRRGPAMQMGSVAYFEASKLAEACPEAHVYFLDAQNEVVSSQHVNITNSATACDTNLLQAMSLPAGLTSAYAKVTFLCGGDDEPQCQMIRLLPQTETDSTGPSTGPSSLAMFRTCMNLVGSATNPATDPATDISTHPATHPATNAASSVLPSSPADSASGVAGALTSSYPPLGGTPTETSQPSAETATDRWLSTVPGGSLHTAAPTNENGPPPASATEVSSVATLDGTTTGLSSVASSTTPFESPSGASSGVPLDEPTSALSSFSAGATDGTGTNTGVPSAGPSDGLQIPTGMTTFITSTIPGMSDAPRCTCQA
ncbi:hypothetical protein CGGC5_v017046 [Colletotrichum fructicola Nara gc5]|uniref:Uncharacterized protein n=2 Tax=Colletotrichum gloeosporioides species complex TaxID=2707338 RepID=A0A7J6IE03_COLFN|nr:hypothetical protein CGGC5_v017046 [Colletotrichum fructicola Nara gc5]